MVGSKDVELEPQESDSDESEVDDGVVIGSKEFEVQKLVGVCYGDPNNCKKIGLYFKVLYLFKLTSSLAYNLLGAFVCKTI